MRCTNPFLAAALLCSNLAAGGTLWNVKNLHKRTTIIARDIEVMDILRGQLKYSTKTNLCWQGNMLWERQAPNCNAYFCEDQTDCLASGGGSPDNPNCPSCGANGNDNICSFI